MKAPKDKDPPEGIYSMQNRVWGFQKLCGLESPTCGMIKVGGIRGLDFEDPMLKSEGMNLN